MPQDGSRMPKNAKDGSQDGPRTRAHRLKMTKEHNRKRRAAYRNRRRRELLDVYGPAYVLVVQCVAVLAAAILLLWHGPEQWDMLLFYLAMGFELRPTWRQ